MTEIEKKKYITTTIVISYYIVIFTYAYFRYIVHFGLDFAINATFIMNKAFAGSAVISVCTAYLISTFSKYDIPFFKKIKSYKRYFGLACFYFICLHIFFGFRIIKPELLPQFFENNTDFSIQGKTIVFLGVIGLVLFLFPAISSLKEVMKKLGAKRWLLFQRIGYLAAGVILIHSSIVGYQNWINIALWYGNMPPISLILSIILFSTLIFRIFTYFKLKK
jgi:DMSO/TMAO reductase YedYZ heme-binding membrane subunit